MSTQKIETTRLYFVNNGLVFEDAGDILNSFAKTTTPLNVGDTIEIGQKTYQVCHYEHDAKNGPYAGLKSITVQSNPQKSFGEDALICPYCCFEADEPERVVISNDEFTCPQCGSIYQWERHTRYVYDIIPEKPPEIKTIEII